jgi:hypothetical protein
LNIRTTLRKACLIGGCFRFSLNASPRHIAQYVKEHGKEAVNGGANFNEFIRCEVACRLEPQEVRSLKTVMCLFGPWVGERRFPKDFEPSQPIDVYANVN